MQIEIKWDYFLASVFVTFVILYLTYPTPKVIVQYPSVNEKMSNMYIDENNVCYRYRTREVNCLNSQIDI